MKIYLSVHDIVDTLERKGHLDNRIFNLSTMQEGTLIHSMYQKNKDSSWINEYPISLTYNFKDLDIFVSGRIDSLKLEPEIVVEEIKSTISDLEEFYNTNSSWHLAQAMFYAYCICLKKEANSATLLLTYIKQGNIKEMKQYTKVVSFDILKDFIDDLMNRYYRYFKKRIKYKEERNSSINTNLKFPYLNIRDGQQKMMDKISTSIDNKEILYVEAPTGTGKTIASLYPCIEKMGKNKVDSIYYLTSKNVIKEIATSSLKSIIDEEVKIKTLEITSKENICFNDKKDKCNPDACPFARNYYDKLFECSFDILDQNDLLNRKVIEEYCYLKKLCPFQFQLDLSKYADITIMDYNYIYDLQHELCLEDIKDEHLKIVTLVDECHNLPFRVKDMYSDTITLYEIKKSRNYLRGTYFKKLGNLINKLIISFSSLPINFDDIENIKKNISILNEIPEDFISLLDDILLAFRTLIKKHSELIIDELLEFYFKLNNIKSIIEDSLKLSRENCYLYYQLLEDNNITSLKIVNLNSTPIIKEKSEYFSSIIYFSATLSPISYYKELLGGDSSIKEDLLRLSSPFNKENRLVLIDSRFSLRYKDRNITMDDIFEDIKIFTSIKKGNYFIFCPSFEYLEKLVSKFEEINLNNEIDIYYQNQGMSINSRNEFLSHFNKDNDKLTLGFIVIGGIFSEGVDLVGDSLIGAVIISVGLPQINFEKNKEMEAFNKINNKDNGFDYAYTYPGINRALQASGRVIRSEEDKGCILFIDSRYSYSIYKNIIEEVYPDYQRVYSNKNIEIMLNNFWRKKDEI